MKKEIEPVITLQNGWLSTSQYNENGCSSGGFDHASNKWYADVHPNQFDENGNRIHLHIESISWRKVNKWLEIMRAKYDLK